MKKKNVFYIKDEVDNSLINDLMVKLNDKILKP